MPDMEPLRSEPTRITVEGTPYVLPALDTFDLDEAMVMYRYSEMTFDMIFELEGLHPGVIAGLLHVGIQRSDPALREKEIKKMVSAVNMMNVLEQLADALTDQPDPTVADPQQPQPDSPTSSDDPTRSSGDSSDDASESRLEKLSPDSSGLPDSDTPVDSAQTTSAV
jgi:hypothetical protein